MTVGQNMQPVPNCFTEHNNPFRNIFIRSNLELAINIFMNSLIDYIDLPEIPKDLLPDVQWIINKPKIDRSKQGLNNQIFHPKNIDNQPLADWLSKNIVNALTGNTIRTDTPFTYFRYQVIYPNFPIHIDKFARRAGINYLLQTGGENVLTQVYNKESEIIESKKIDVNKWHYLIAEQPHNAVNIETVRVAVAITLRPDEEDIFFKKIGYVPHP
jgi:hypothetical protein